MLLGGCAELLLLLGSGIAGECAQGGLGTAICLQVFSRDPGVALFRSGVEADTAIKLR